MQTVPLEDVTSQARELSDYYYELARILSR
jgi:hypothetical protein